jgi:hypothetical protein
MNEEPSIYFANIRIDEPVTTLTDLLVAGVCIYAFIRLIKDFNPSKGRTFFSVFFFGLGLGTMLGGLLGHGFLYRLHPAWQLPGWLMSMAATSFLVLGSLEMNKKSIHRGLAYLLTGLNVMAFIVTGILVIISVNFIYVVLQIAFNLLVIILFVHVYGWIRSKDSGHILFFAAIAVMILVAFIFLLKLSFNQWINQNSLSHALMAVSAFLFYLGARRFFKKRNWPSQVIK